MVETEKIDWNNISNKKIHENLLSLNHEHDSLKDKILKLMSYLNEIEKEYEYGNNILNKRYKGDE
tara:strand:+ start:665 stop:859 length:195 start_codon:yes stop_codon:yes gene_type:complete